MIATLADNIVVKQLGRLIADAEALMRVVAWVDLPAGLRIIDCDGSRLAGFSSGSGHLLAQAHGFRPGSVAVAVAAEAALRTAFDWWADEPAVVMAEAAVLIESVSCHELSHCLVADIDGEMMPHQADILRRLPAAVGTVKTERSHERTARDHGPAWAAGMVILAGRCMRYRWARHRWQHLLERDLHAYGIDANAVADAVRDVADEVSLREKLAPHGAIVARVAEAIPDEQERAALIADFYETTSAESGHVAQVAAGDSQ
jgi:hypothetical protein